LAELKVLIMTRYEKWRANPSSVQPQAPASHPVPQPLVAHRGINSHGTNTPTSSSSSRSQVSISLQSRAPLPYEQSPSDDDRAERVDALLREEPRSVLSSSHSSHSLHTLDPSYATDVFTQSSQFRPATYQPDPTQNPTSTPPNVAHPAPSQHHVPPSRPYSIGELAERAKQILGKDPKPFKAWLRIAENARRDAKSSRKQGDLESAFVEYAKAATIVLEKIPAHPDYMVLLSTTQRHNMGLVSFFYPVCFDNGGSVGHVHVPCECTDECVFRVLHDFRLIQNCTHFSISRANHGSSFIEWFFPSCDLVNL
jgi:hypothetical protein